MRNSEPGTLYRKALLTEFPNRPDFHQLWDDGKLDDLRTALEHTEGLAENERITRIAFRDMLNGLCTLSSEPPPQAEV